MLIKNSKGKGGGGGGGGGGGAGGRGGGRKVVGRTGRCCMGI